MLMTVREDLRLQRRVRNFHALMGFIIANRRVTIDELASKQDGRMHEVIVQHLEFLKGSKGKMVSCIH